MDEERSSEDASDEFIVRTNLFLGNSFELNSATLSDDSGFVPNSSISSGSSRGIGLCPFQFELAESDAEVSQFDSLDNFSDGGMSAENFNTLKKGPFLEPPPEFQDSPQTTLLRAPSLQNYSFRLTKTIITRALREYGSQLRHSQSTYFDTSSSSGQTTIAKKPSTPCLRHCKGLYGGSDSFLNRQYETDNIYDEPNSEFYDNHLLYVNKAVHQHHTMVVANDEVVYDYDLYYFKKRNLTPIDSYKRRRTPTSSLLYSPLHHHHYHYYHTGSSSGNRPNSRNSLNSRLSSSHNSLHVPGANKADDSIFITQAMSHDALVGAVKEGISDMYNVPIDSDIYSLPVDSIKTKSGASRRSSEKPRKAKFTRNNKRRRRHLHTSRSNATNLTHGTGGGGVDKRHSVPENRLEPHLHQMSLDEVKKYYHNLYSSSSESSDIVGGAKSEKRASRVAFKENVGKKEASKGGKIIKNRPKEPSPPLETNNNKTPVVASVAPVSVTKKSQFSITFNLRQKFCNIFRFRHKNRSHDEADEVYGINNNNIKGTDKNKSSEDKRIQLSSRALPPLPPEDSSKGTPEPGVTSSSCEKIVEDAEGSVREEEEEKSEETAKARMDFAANIEKVKEYGWYWGPISSETAEKILSNEPDGSFIVRDSSDDHYIFSLTFKIAGCVRHVRIEQDQGTFSFGSCAKFKSRTIVEFIENAVEHSRSGRYLFFLNRRPEHGPMRIQLLEPVSRFKRIQSLQHMCRFVIRKAVVRKDLIQTLPLPRRILDYLSYKNCFAEQIDSDSSSQSQIYGRSNNVDSN